MPAPTPDGRTGKVSAGCVFWMKATERAFTTVPEDHGNCNEMTCAIPAGRLAEVIDKLKTTCTADNTVAAYASEDGRRFGARFGSEV